MFMLSFLIYFVLLARAYNSETFYVATFNGLWINFSAKHIGAIIPPLFPFPKPKFTDFIVQEKVFTA